MATLNTQKFRPLIERLETRLNCDATMSASQPPDPVPDEEPYVSLVETIENYWEEEQRLLDYYDSIMPNGPDAFLYDNSDPTPVTGPINPLL